MTDVLEIGDGQQVLADRGLAIIAIDDEGAAPRSREDRGHVRRRGGLPLAGTRRGHQDHRGAAGCGTIAVARSQRRCLEDEQDRGPDRAETFGGPGPRRIEHGDGVLLPLGACELRDLGDDGEAGDHLDVVATADPVVPDLHDEGRGQTEDESDQTTDEGPGESRRRGGHGEVGLDGLGLGRDARGAHRTTGIDVAVVARLESTGIDLDGRGGLIDDEVRGARRFGGGKGLELLVGESILVDDRVELCSEEIDVARTTTDPGFEIETLGLEISQFRVDRLDVLLVLGLRFRRGGLDEDLGAGVGEVDRHLRLGGDGGDVDGGDLRLRSRREQTLDILRWDVLIRRDPVLDLSRLEQERHLIEIRRSSVGTGLDDGAGGLVERPHRCGTGTDEGGDETSEHAEEHTCGHPSPPASEHRGVMPQRIGRVAHVRGIGHRRVRCGGVRHRAEWLGVPSVRIGGEFEVAQWVLRTIEPRSRGVSPIPYRGCRPLYGHRSRPLHHQFRACRTAGVAHTIGSPAGPDRSG